MGGIDFIQDLGLVMLVAAFAAWLCQRIGLPVVIGYLGAGVLISPHTHSFGLVSDGNRIQALAQVGLVFLIFGIGQGLPLQRLKRVGLPLFLGAILTALFVLIGCRWLGAMLGWPDGHSLVLAAILMASSTAVLRRGLHAAKAVNTTFGQTALTVTALDDLIAVVMLTLLASVVQSGGTDAAALLEQFVRVPAVIVALAVGALLLLPPLLNRLNRSASSEVVGLVIAGGLLSMALISARAGFSPVPGAFLLGAIVSTTGRSEQIGQSLGALCGVFGPVFFVAMGMLLNFKVLLAAWPLVLGVLALALVLRLAAASAALLMVGHSVHDATRAAVALTPVGEFSLILALTGVQGGIVPESFFAVAVAVCFFSAVTTPSLIRHSRRISNWVEARQPRPIAQLIGLYHHWIENLKQSQNASFLWRLTAPRLVQLSILVLFVSGLLIFASPFYIWAGKWLGLDWPVARALPVVFWACFLFLVVAPLVAIWRQVEALAMICAEAATKGHPSRSILSPLFEKVLRTFVLVAILAWFAMLIPYQAIPGWSLLAFAAAIILVASIFWRRLIRLHSRFEIELRAHLSDSPFVSENPALPGWPKRNGQWKMNLAEVVLEANAQAVGSPIAALPLRSKFTCTIVRIERQGLIISNPGPDTGLFPNDKLLLLGADANLRAAEQWLNEPKQLPAPADHPSLAELSLGHLVVPPTFRQAGKPLAELGIRSQFGIQVVGIERDDESLLSPGPRETFTAGDQLLVLGTPEQVSEMAVWLSN